RTLRRLRHHRRSVRPRTVPVHRNRARSRLPTPHRPAAQQADGDGTRPRRSHRMTDLTSDLFADRAHACGVCLDHTPDECETLAPPARHCSQAGVQAWKGPAAYTPRPTGVIAPAGPPPPRLFPTDGRAPHMATPRRLRITIEVGDDG